MTTSSETLSMRLGKSMQRTGERVIDSTSLDRWIAILSSIFLAGLFLDGWAHNNIPQLIDTFFTPYHALLYGGFFAVAGTLAFTLVRNVARGVALREALPKAYIPAMLGVLLFLAGGVGDFIWHETFGFEDDIEALLSPTHLVLAAGAVLYITAPLRSLWQRKDSGTATWSTLWPALFSMLTLLSLLTFFTQYATLARPGAMINVPVGRDMEFLRSQQGIFLMLMPSILLTGSVLFLMRRWQLPFGSLTFLVGVNSTLMFVMSWNDSMKTPAILPAILLAALAIDLLYAWLQPSENRSTAIRVFAFAMPFVMTAFLMAALLMTQTLWWEIHMWAGIPFITGAAGLFLSFLTNPMPVQE